MSLATNIVKRPGSRSYYLRAAVPADLQAALGKREVWKSLRTADPQVARRRGDQARIALQRRWDEERRTLGGELRWMETERRRRMDAEREKRNGTAILSDSDITRLAGELFRTELEHDDMFRLTLPRREAIEQLRKQVEHDIINDPVIASLNGKERHLAIMDKTLDFVLARDSRQRYKEGRRDQFERVRQALANDEFGGEDDALTWFLDDVIERYHLGVAKGFGGIPSVEQSHAPGHGWRTSSNSRPRRGRLWSQAN